MLRGTREVEAEKAKVASLAAIRFCGEERVKEELPPAHSFSIYRWTRSHSLDKRQNDSSEIQNSCAFSFELKG